MARTNQGIFKEILNNYNSAEKDYKVLLQDYFDKDDEWKDGPDYNDFFQEANGVWVQLDDVITEMSNMLRNQKFENKATKESYEKKLQETNRMKGDVEIYFSRIYDVVRISMSEKHREWLGDYSIYKVITKN